MVSINLWNYTQDHQDWAFSSYCSLRRYFFRVSVFNVLDRSRKSEAVECPIRFISFVRPSLPQFSDDCEIQWHCTPSLARALEEWLCSNYHISHNVLNYTIDYHCIRIILAKIFCAFLKQPSDQEPIHVSTPNYLLGLRPQEDSS